jgi:hypothetical protein
MPALPVESQAASGRRASPEDDWSPEAARILADLLRSMGRSADPSRRARIPADGRRAVAALNQAIALVVGTAATRELLLRLAPRPSFLTPAVETAVLAATVGAARRWSDDRLMKTALAGLLADVGMMLLPEAIVTKPGRPSPSEEAQLRQHPELGARLLEPLLADDTREVAEIVWQHHERLDGTGFPRGLTGTRIAEEAQVVGICQVYLAGVAGSSYRRPLPPWKVLQLIASAAGTGFDPRLVRATREGLAAHPVGALARLSSGECGRILPGPDPLAPIVEVRWALDGTPVPPRQVVTYPDDDRLHVVAVADCSSP